MVLRLHQTGRRRRLGLAAAAAADAGSDAERAVQVVQRRARPVPA